jgi:hypothetical protein
MKPLVLLFEEGRICAFVFGLCKRVSGVRLKMSPRPEGD